MLEVTPIKAFSDNYLWLFRQSGSKRAAIVDPGDPAPVLSYLEREQLELEAILVTHHHADHTGGIRELLEHYEVPVYGPESSAIPQVTQTLHEGDSIQVCGTLFRVLEIPGHTLDHIAYYAESPAPNQDPVLFCGDTLFAAGCGRLFEGTAETMHASLLKLAALPPETQAFCAHEYTLANLAFAAAVTPDDAVLQSRIAEEKQKREQGLPTVPTSIALEKQTNPFLRCDEEPVRLNLKMPTARPAEVFAALREWKDSF